MWLLVATVTNNPLEPLPIDGGNFRIISFTQAILAARQSKIGAVRLMMLLADIGRLLLVVIVLEKLHTLYYCIAHAYAQMQAIAINTPVTVLGVQLQAYNKSFHSDLILASTSVSLSPIKNENSGKTY